MVKIETTENLNKKYGFSAEQEQQEQEQQEQEQQEQVLIMSALL